MKSQKKPIQGVYFILAPNQNRVKIGRSNNIPRRFQNLRTGFMDDGHLILSIVDEDDVELENWIHRKFRRDNIYREWFFLSEGLRKFITSARYNYDEVIEYDEFDIIHDLERIKNVDVYDFLYKFRRTIYAYSIPLLQFLFGAIVGFFTYRFFTDYHQGEYDRFIGMFFAVFYTIFAPFTGYLVIKYGPLFFVNIYFYTALLTYCILLLYWFFPDNTIVNAIGILIAVFVYPSMTRAILYLPELSKETESYTDHVNAQIESELKKYKTTRIKLIQNKIKGKVNYLLPNDIKMIDRMTFLLYLFIFLIILIAFISVEAVMLKLVVCVPLIFASVFSIYVRKSYKKELKKGQVLRFSEGAPPYSILLHFLVVVGIWLYRGHELLIFVMLLVVLMGFYIISEYYHYAWRRKTLKVRKEYVILNLIKDD